MIMAVGALPPFFDGDYDDGLARLFRP